MGNAVIYIYVCGQCHTQFMRCRLTGCSICQHVRFEQTITHQHALLRQEIFIDRTAVTIIFCTF